MQGMIDRILDEQFGCDNGTLDFSCAKIEINIPAGSDFEGSFRICSAPGLLTDGYVNTTDLRMECLTPTFAGSDEEISFCFHGDSMEEGEVVKGSFNVVSNLGEYYLPFVVSVAYQIPDSSIGTIKNLFHFANLAKSNWQEAVKMFYSPLFACIFTGSDAKVYDSYRGLSACPGNEQNVEEFLVQINKKQRVEFLVEEKEMELELSVYENPYKVLEHELAILRNGWGYTALHVECDGDFVFTEKEFLTDDDFLGNRCRLPVYVDSSLCRKGKNFGQVVLYNSHVCITVPVTVKKGEREQSDVVKKRIIVQLMEFYQAFRMKKINSTTWLKETGKLVDKLVAMDENDVPTRLFQAQLLISEERYNEAEWILDHSLSLMENEKPESETLEAYYLYLTTLIHREADYVNQIATRVQQIYRKDNSRWRVAWLLLYLTEEYAKSPTAKWIFLEKQFYYGCSSPILYIEAILLLGNNPSLLRRLDKYELQVLYYGARQQMLGPELVEQILYLVGRVRDYSAVLCEILCHLYEKKKETRILREICALLIKGGKSGTQYFAWYKKGVEEQLRITNLYEYYMMSLDLSVQQPLPRMVLMYFAYQNNLDYEHSAYLYQYILRHKEEFPEIYENYRMRIERFVVEQIQKRHINRNLAALYQSLLTPGMITEETASALSRLLFAHQIQVEDSRLHKVIVYQAGSLRPGEYVLTEGSTWLPLYGNDYTIVFEDRWGNRFIKNIEYTLEKLMMPGKFVRMIAHYERNCPELDRYVCETEHYEITTDTLERALRVAADEGTVYDIRRELYLKVVQFYHENDRMDELDCFLEQVPVEKLHKEDRSVILKYMVLRGRYDAAFGWIARYSPYFAEISTLEKLISEMMRRNNMAKDATLTAAAVYVFRKGKYDSTILKYLNLYFEGLTKDMRDIWKASRTYEIDCYDLSERILLQMLYSKAFVGEETDILRYYVSHGARQEVEQAFLIQCAYDYFVNEKLTDSYVFGEIRQAYLRGEEISRIGKLAFLKYYAENPDEMSPEDKPLLADFLDEMLDQEIFLNFFRQLKGFENMTRCMGDKTIVEYRTRPGGRASIHYVIVNENGESDEYLTEYMTEVYGGVCFKEFVLFFGESLLYYIMEEYDGEKELTESGTIQKSEITGETGGNYYALVNDIMISKTLQDYDTLDELYEDFCRKAYWNKQLFTLQ